MTQKEFLEGTEEVNEISWDEALAQKGAFMKFESGKRVRIAITDWRIVEVERADFNNPDVMKVQPQFEAKVLSEEDEACDKKLSILSKRFIAAVREFLEGKDDQSTVYLSVKKIGESTSTNYDIEEYKPGD